ncbi:uncharacterized protein [Montipora foliosa]|uniref:uncharacterized protein n=1 Tax=Montipora foliosa TaxID=591990 RepID=UPI0035F20D25
MDVKIVMSLETEEDILKDTESALMFQDISDWQFKIEQFVKSKEETPLSQFHHSSFKQAPTPRMHINLPKINIKSFGGDPLEWLTFWDSFSAVIDKNFQLSNFKKNGMLKGEAAHAISGLPLTDENYRNATELLKECFGKTQNLTNAYMESLSKIHAPSSDTKNLREFYDICETNIRGLETLGIMTKSYGSLIIPILLKKIPDDIRHLIFRADPLADSSLEDSTSSAMDGEAFIPTAGAY